MPRNVNLWSLARRLLAVVILGSLLSIVVSSKGIPTAKDGTQVAEAFPNAENVRVAAQGCLPDGTAEVAFAWQSFNQGSQWLDLSLSNNGFAPGTFVGLGPLASNQASQPWGGILPGLTHFMRVNTLTSFGWQPSSTVAFTSRGDCRPLLGAGASNLNLVSQNCGSDNRVNVNLAWQPSNLGIQWVDFSLFDNGFAGGTFLGVGPLQPQQNTLAFGGLLPGRWHAARVTTFVGDWVASPTLWFFTRTDCVAPPPSTPTPAPTTTPTPVPATLTPTPAG